MNTRNLIFIILLQFLAAGEITAGNPPYMTPTGRLDNFKIELYNNETQAKCDGVSIQTNNETRSDVYNSKKGDAADMGAENEDLTARKNTIVNGKLNPTYLTAIAMPYGDNYFIDIPLRIQKMKVGVEYYFTIVSGAVTGAARIIQITDQTTGEVSVNLLDEGSVFKFTPDKATYEFNLRIYGGEPFKETTANDEESNLWSKASNWLSGKLPKEDSYVIIPEGTQTVISSGSDIKVGYLTNLGTIVNNGTLNVTDFMEVSSNKINQ